MNEQPEALRWAGILEHQAHYDGPTDYKHKAAAELRRLTEVNQELVEALERLEMTAGIPAMQDDPVRIKARAALAKAKGESNEPI